LDISELEYLDYSYESLSNLEKDELIEIIQLLRKDNDELKKIQRSPEGEVVISDDDITNDEEEIIT
jgi:hypothetical protein